MTIADTLIAEPPPLRLDESGTLRVGSTRIALDLVIEAHESGSTPEEIVAAYDSLTLADVYGSITYYLRHRDEVREYLEQRREQAEQWKQVWQDRCPTSGLKEELLRRRRQNPPHSEAS